MTHRAELRLRDVLARNVDCYAGEPAIVSSSTTLSWATLQHHVHQLANRLHDEGVSRGARVLLLQPNEYEIVEVSFAVALLGATVVPMSPRLSEDEVRFIAADSQPSFAFVEARHPVLEDGLGVPTVETRSGDFERFRDGGDAVEPADRETADDAVFQLYTSGTTGRPKGVVLSQRAMIQNGLTLQLSQQLTHDDVFLATTPLTHAAAGTRLFSLALDGIALAILDRWSPEAFFAAVERHRVTTTILVPTMLEDVLASPALADADLSSLRLLVYGAAPSDGAVVQRALERLSCGLVHGWGLTEGCPALTILGPDEHRRCAGDPALRHRLRSIGRPVPGVRIRVVGDDGTAVKAGQAGELQVRSTKSMTGYWGMPASTDAAFVDGWLATGDIGSCDESGYLYLLARKKEMIISGGLNVYPSEIERILLEDPAVANAAVVGTPHSRWGECPVAFVVPSTSVIDGGRAELGARLTQRCRARLAGYKQPVAIVFLDELPRNQTGKVVKTELADEAAAAASAALLVQVDGR